MAFRHISLGALIAFILVFVGCKKDESDTIVDPLANYYNALPTSDSATVPLISIGIGIEGGGYHLRWQDCPFAVHYEVEAGNVHNNWNWRLVSVTGAPSYNAGEIPGNAQQKFRVRAVYEEYNSKWSEVSVP